MLLLIVILSLYFSDTAGTSVPKELPEGCRIRLFVADGDFPPAVAPKTPLIAPHTPAILLPLPSMAPETPAAVTGLPESPPYSNKICYTAEGEDWPMPLVRYFVAIDDGITIFGETGDNGCTARFYSSQPKDFTGWYGEDALARSQEKHSPSDAEGHWETLCFAAPGSRRLTAGYPYFAASKNGWAAAGRTQDSGCSPAIYMPAGEPFIVYGGSDALRMNTLGQKD